MFLSRGSDRPDGADGQRELTLEKWASRSPVVLSKGKLRVMPVGNNPRHQHRPKTCWKTAPERRTLGLWRTGG